MPAFMGATLAPKEIMLAETVLVTGATGFIGRIVTQALVQAGYRVRAASRTGGPVAGAAESVRLPEPPYHAGQWGGVLVGAAHIVHCAGIAHTRLPLAYADYRVANAELPGALAKAAAQAVPGRFVFISSIRAMSGPGSPIVLDETVAPAPTDDYGRSKLEGERLVEAAYGADDRCLILRPTLVYGPGVKGNLAALARLARLPLPLPLGGLTAKRSLLDVASLAEAILHLLTAPAGVAGTYLVCDREPVSTAEIVAALQSELARGPRLFAIPDRALAVLMALARRRNALTFPLVADPARLTATGWAPADDTLARLRAYARQGW